MKIYVLGPPVPKGRPRFNRSRTNFYTPAETVEYEERVAWAVREAGVKYLNHPVSFCCEFHYKGKRLKDVDNMLKSALDGAEKGGLFENDNQAVFQSAMGYPDALEDKTVIDVKRWPIEGHMMYCEGVLTPVLHGVCGRCGEVVQSVS